MVVKTMACSGEYCMKGSHPDAIHNQHLHARTIRQVKCGRSMMIANLSEQAPKKPVHLS